MGFWLGLHWIMDHLGRGLFFISSCFLCMYPSPLWACFLICKMWMIDDRTLYHLFHYFPHSVNGINEIIHGGNLTPCFLDIVNYSASIRTTPCDLHPLLSFPLCSLMYFFLRSHLTQILNCVFPLSFFKIIYLFLFLFEPTFLGTSATLLYFVQRGKK